jgi:hypothetical protein
LLTNQQYLPPHLRSEFLLGNAPIQSFMERIKNLAKIKSGVSPAGETAAGTACKRFTNKKKKKQCNLPIQKKKLKHFS